MLYVYTYEYKNAIFKLNVLHFELFRIVTRFLMSVEPSKQWDRSIFCTCVYTDKIALTGPLATVYNSHPSAHSFFMPTRGRDYRKHLMVFTTIERYYEI